MPLSQEERAGERESVRPCLHIVVSAGDSSILFFFFFATKSLVKILNLKWSRKGKKDNI